MNDFCIWLLAVVGIIPRTGSDEEIRLEVRGTDKKNELENPTHFSYFLPFASRLLPFAWQHRCRYTASGWHLSFSQAASSAESSGAISAYTHAW